MGGFDDLDDAMADEEQPDDHTPDDADSTDMTDDTTTTTAETTSTSSTTNTTPAASTDEQGKEADWQTTPAFPYDEVSQEQMYVRDDLWDEWEDTRRFDVERILANRDIRNVHGREMDEAAIRVLNEHAEEIADEVEAARRD
jgi:hypothetical protein